MPKVSVIIPTYNRTRYLSKAIDSVLSQTYKDYEIIVVDDGSTDNTKEVLQKYMGKIKYLYQENKGIAAARNFGIRNSTGDFIGFLDNDDQWLPNKLEIQIKTLEKNSKLAFVCSASHVIDEQGSIIDFWRVKSKESFENLFEGNFILCLTVLMRRQCLDKIGGFDIAVSGSDDWDMWLRLSKSYQFCHIDIPLTKYRIHNSNVSKDIEGRIKRDVIIINKREINEKFSLFRIKTRLAKLYYSSANIYQHGDKFYPDIDFKKASKYYLKAVIEFPLIGYYYWPEEIVKIRFSLPYRVLKVYLLIMICFLKGFIKNDKLMSKLIPSRNG
jgi:hypothetical protein